MTSPKLAFSSTTIKTWPKRTLAAGGGGVIAVCPTQPASAKTQKAGARNRNRAADRNSEKWKVIVFRPILQRFMALRSLQYWPAPPSTLLSTEIPNLEIMAASRIYGGRCIDAPQETPTAKGSRSG